MADVTGTRDGLVALMGVAGLLTEHPEAQVAAAFEHVEGTLCELQEAMTKTLAFLELLDVRATPEAVEEYPAALLPLEVERAIGRATDSLERRQRVAARLGREVRP